MHLLRASLFLGTFAFWIVGAVRLENSDATQKRRRDSTLRGLLKDTSDDVHNLVFAELGMHAGAKQDGEHGFCELCIYAVHQVQYGELPSCGGSSRAFSYDACSQVTQSMLAFAQDMMHLISYGCYQYDAYKGWQTVKPCPAHVMCGRLPNIYDTQQKTMCPADFHYRFPHALGNRNPTVFNPLLKYAVNQYQNKALPQSSVLQTPGMASGLPRFRQQSARTTVQSSGASNLQPAQVPQTLFQNPQNLVPQASGQQMPSMALQMAQMGIQAPQSANFSP
jgi:hypothetical protein